MGLGDDGFAILNTLAAHMHARDRRDPEWMATLWAEDAVLERVGWPEDIRVEGRDAIVSFFCDPAHGGEWAAKWFGGAVGAKHLLLNPVVRIDGDEAVAVSDTAWLYVLGAPDEGGSELKAVGQLVDRLRRVDGDWVIAARSIVAEIPGVPEAAAAAARAVLATIPGLMRG